MADTGCQSCLFGLKCLQKLGFHKKDLIPVNMKMHAANRNKINILGAAILCLSGTTKSSLSIGTCQITYFTDNTDKYFISIGACIDLGMISGKFPTICEVTVNPISTNEDDTT